MAYNKPDIEVDILQETQSPILVTPDLEAVLIGEGYYWQDPAGEDSLIPNITYNGVQLDIPISGINSTITSLVSGMSVVDLVVVSGQSGTINSVMHLSGDELQYIIASGQTVPTILRIPAISGLTTSKCSVKVGCLAKKQSSDYGFKILYSLKDIVDTIGPAVSWNPLAFGAKLAMLNSGKTVNVINVSGVTSTAVETEIDAVLPNKELYALAPVTRNVTMDYLKNHAVTYSKPENKKERVALYNLDLSGLWTGTAFKETQTDKATTAGKIRDKIIAYQEKRLVVIFPDAAYAQETRPIATIKPSFIANSFDSNFKNYNLKAKLISDVTLSNGTKYKANTEITDAIYKDLVANGFDDANGYVTVKVPVPGYYYTAQVAGQTIGNNPEQPLTNLPTGGLLETLGSQDYFNDTQLNTIAEAGIYIMTQDSETSPIVSRHQQTTDTTTTEVNEYSIVKSLDYAAKFARKSVKPYVGRYNVTPAYLRLLETILVGVSLFLVREGRVADMKVLSVKQDPNKKDSVIITISVQCLYPSNHIKIVLIF